jgi:hypothetical protein
VCFIVRDHNGQALAYAHFEDEPGAANVLTRDEAQRAATTPRDLPPRRASTAAAGRPNEPDPY